MIVRRCDVVKMEAIVRGYITGVISSNEDLGLSHAFYALQGQRGRSTRKARRCTGSKCQQDWSSRRSWKGRSSRRLQRLSRESTTRISTRTKVNHLQAPPYSVDTSEEIGLTVVFLPLVKDICGPEVAAEIERVSLQLYSEWAGLCDRRVRAIRSAEHFF